jgi:hypothetical protein
MMPKLGDPDKRQCLREPSRIQSWMMLAAVIL